MNTLDAILTRRSCREFTDKPIKSETLHQLLEAAMSGPSCVNAQDWSFVVVTDPEKLAQMADANGRPAEPLRKAAAGILVCGDLDRAFRFAKDYWVPGLRWTGWRPNKSCSLCRRPLCPTPSSPLATRKQTLLPRVRAAMRMTGYILTGGRSARRKSFAARQFRSHVPRGSHKPRAFLLDTLPYCSSFIQVEQTVQNRLSSVFSFFSIITQTTSWLQR